MPKPGFKLDFLYLKKLFKFYQSFLKEFFASFSKWQPKIQRSIIQKTGKSTRNSLSKKLIPLFLNKSSACRAQAHKICNDRSITKLQRARARAGNSSAPAAARALAHHIEIPKFPSPGLPRLMGANSIPKPESRGIPRQKGGGSVIAAGIIHSRPIDERAREERAAARKSTRAPGNSTIPTRLLRSGGICFSRVRKYRVTRVAAVRKHSLLT